MMKYAFVNGMALLASAALVACGGGGGASSPPPPNPTITSVTVTPTIGQLRTGDSLSFQAGVRGTGRFDPNVTWLVDNIQGGDAAHGTITSAGVYTAPTNVPNANSITITAKSVQDTTKSGTASATVFSLVISPSDPNVPYGHTQQFTAQVTGLSNPTVQFGIVQGSGQITNDGFYTATTWISSPTKTETI
jgi:hypothetical protein